MPGTAHIGLAYRANLAQGEWLLVHGAAGGVGLAAVQVGRCMGARVIATAGSDAKRAIAGANGADHALAYDDLKDKVKALTDGKGVNVVFDPVGGEVFEQSLRCVDWAARLVVVGFASGDIPQIPANLVLQAVEKLSFSAAWCGTWIYTRKPETAFSAQRVEKGVTADLPKDDLFQHPSL